MEPKVILLLGVSGSGKSTVMKQLLQKYDKLKYVPSYCTRDPRPGEYEGNPYHFISLDEFKKGIEDGDFLEYEFVHNLNYYGTNKKALLAPLKEGYSTIKEIDVFGLEQIRTGGKIDGKYVALFLNVSDDVMIQRINQRHEMDEQELQERLNSAKHERLFAGEICDHIINADRNLEDIVVDVCDVIEKS